MNVASWLLWGFAATIVMTTMSSALQGLGLTLMNLPYMLGTIFTPNRDKARLLGFIAHVGLGLLFSLFYVLIFQALGAAGWWRGLIIGLIHAMFMLLVVTALLPSLHPRMASEQYGPEAHNVLEPPGFMGLHYGPRTPLVIALSHAVFGTILGAFYQLK